MALSNGEADAVVEKNGVSYLRARDLISLEKQAASVLRASEERYRSLFQSMTQGFCSIEMVFDADNRPVDYRFVEVNPAFERQTGCKVAQGKLMRELMPDQEAYWCDIFGEVAVTGEPARFEREAGNSRRWYEVLAYRIEAPELRRVAVLLNDVTRRKRIEEELQAAVAASEQANMAKSRFLAAVSHDLRQPLSALALYADSLPATVDHNLAVNMKSCIAGLSEMLSNLLDLSKLDAGVVKPAASDFALDAILDKLASSHEPEARAKGLAFRLRGSTFVGHSDPVLFQRIVGNFIANAVRYTDKGGLLIGWRQHGGKQWLEIWDTGRGIPADKTAEIFEEFRQLGNRERDRSKGSGLGLAIAAKTAALLGLQIRLRSFPGRGSMFAVELPPGIGVGSLPQVQYRHRALRIALVEDNAEVALALSYALTHFGHEVVSAGSRIGLMQNLGGVAPDILISDYRLSGDEDGFSVIASLRTVFGQQLPAILITGDTDPEVIRRMSEQQVSVQHKPLDLEKLRQRIAELTA